MTVAADALHFFYKKAGAAEPASKNAAGGHARRGSTKRPTRVKGSRQLTGQGGNSSNKGLGIGVGRHFFFPSDKIRGSGPTVSRLSPGRAIGRANAPKSGGMVKHLRGGKGGGGGRGRRGEEGLGSGSEEIRAQEPPPSFDELSRWKVSRGSVAKMAWLAGEVRRKDFGCDYSEGLCPPYPVVLRPTFFFRCPT